eukprot:30807-Pelagococcus_subviridis.AAC.2
MSGTGSLAFARSAIALGGASSASSPRARASDEASPRFFDAARPWSRASGSNLAACCLLPREGRTSLRARLVRRRGRERARARLTPPPVRSRRRRRTRT